MNPSQIHFPDTIVLKDMHAHRTLPVFLSDDHPKIVVTAGSHQHYTAINMDHQETKHLHQRDCLQSFFPALSNFIT
jgi:hypothetical protein